MNFLCAMCTGLELTWVEVSLTRTANIFALCLRMCVKRDGDPVPVGSATATRWGIRKPSATALARGFDEGLIRLQSIPFRSVPLVSVSFDLV